MKRPNILVGTILKDARALWSFLHFTVVNAFAIWGPRHRMNFVTSHHAVYVVSSNRTSPSLRLEIHIIRAGW